MFDKNSAFSLSIDKLHKDILLRTINASCIDWYNVLSELLEKASTTDEKIYCIDLLCSYQDDDGTAVISASYLDELGFEAYNKDEIEFAVHCFIRSIEKGSVHARNNLVYILRRNESKLSKEYSALEMIELLKPCVEIEDAFSSINVALVFSLILGKDKDWQICDKIMKKAVIFPDTDNAFQWWDSLKDRNEVEGFLVVYFYLKYKENNNITVSKEELRSKLIEAIPNFPTWL